MIEIYSKEDIKKIIEEEVTREVSKRIGELQPMINAIVRHAMAETENSATEKHQRKADDSMPLNDIPMSVRTANCLANARFYLERDILTVGDLCRATEAELLRIKNMGKGGLREIRTFLFEVGRSLGDAAQE